QKKEEKRIKEAQQQEEMEESTVRFEPISLFEEEKPKQSMMFGRIDADDAYEEEQVLFDATKQKNGTIQFIDVDEVVGASKPKQTIVQKESEPTVIEQITGKKDNFVSQYEIDYSKYRLPKLSLLKESGRKGRSSANITAANESGKRLMEILEEFGVKATLTATHIGPSVTKFEVKPDLGVRVNKISNLQHDIKMALAAKDIRIEAPIPGKSAVGIEIPNVEKTAVSMRELMKEVPAKYHDSKLMFALGKDLLGNGIYGELNKMPHLLIAGATGSGKSVCVNSIITSILLRSRPDEVKLLLIDPKKVEFTPYHNIPHLIAPVITDGEEASRALKVIVTMMDNRYELFSMAGVRNIAGYNAYLEKHPEEQLSKLPWIVVIIDELADLMLVAAKDVEASIQRITQLARAAGIHLIVATQRPSVDVITGIIKANIPSRIAFAVSSAVDSRTILDQSGAEKLLGYGDMLYIPVGEQVPLRVQGAFVSDEEVAAITQFVSAQGKPKFEDAFVRLEMLDGSVGMSGGDSGDPLYEEVKAFVIEARKASTSLIQRKFSIGYSRAARLIDVLEENGVIGPSRGSKPREVYAKAEKEYEDE
ncbi:MAG TPA: DNA translocase FtsK, partial [Candidatus Onthosoma merdavium]|nr:DNA translocase FtsK [Candidatus Onthosoma merdavium]